MRQGYRACVRGWLALAVPALLPAIGPTVGWSADPQPPAAPAAAIPAFNPLNRTSGKILVMPFVAVNPNDTNPWVGKSVQQSLVADLTAAAPDRILSTDKTAPTAEDALKIARDLGARFLVAGGFFSSGSELRITGQVLDVETGQPLVGLKVTGESGQIFHMEDALANQVEAGISRDPRDVTHREAPRPPADVEPPPSSTGVRTDGLESPPPAGTYSPYAFGPSANDSYSSDYSRYVYSSPSVIYYNGYYTPYCAPYSSFYGCAYPFSSGFGLSFSFADGWGRGFVGTGRDHDHREGHHEGRTGGRSVITNASINASRFDPGSIDGITVTRGLNSSGSVNVAGSVGTGPRVFSSEGSTRFQSSNFNGNQIGSAPGMDRTSGPRVYTGRGYDGRGYDRPRGGDAPRAASSRDGNNGGSGSANGSRASGGNTGGGHR